MKLHVSYCLIIISLISGYTSKAQNNPIKIISTSTDEYKQKPNTSIYPAFVDGMPYQAWTKTNNTAYYQLIAEAGQQPYKWVILKGKLPDGIILKEDGKLQGTPLKEGKFSFVVKVTDALGKTCEKSLNFTAEPYRSKWMADAKFGIMIQWGAYTQPTLTNKEGIKVFEERIKNFNADQWAEAVVNMGGKVLNFTVKHADGIRLWPSTTPSRYELKTTRNIVGELITACHKKGVRFVAYFAPDNSWNNKETALDGTWGTLNKGLIKELVEMGVDGLWIDMGGTPELFKGSVDPSWFPWNEIIPVIRNTNPYTIFANNPGLGNGGTVLRWPNTDVLLYEGGTASGETALMTAKPSILTKKVALEVDNLLDNTWSWRLDKNLRTPKSPEMIIKNIKANWAVGATYMLNYPVPPDGTIVAEEYTSTLSKIGSFVKAHQGWSNIPIPSLNNDSLYTTSQTLTLKAPANSKIYYTLDGTTPFEKSKVYSGPIKLSKNTRIKAITIEKGKPASKVMDKNYVFNQTSKTREIKTKSLISSASQSKKGNVELKEYYRGMRITIKRNPVLISRIGRQFLKGNKNNHNIIVKRYHDDYPILLTKIDTRSSEVEPDGFQYVAIPPLRLEVGQSYIIASKEDSTDKYASDSIKSNIENDDIRISGSFILSNLGDQKPVIADGVGSILNLKYNLLPNAKNTNLALGATTQLLDNNDHPLGPSRELEFAENAVDGDMSTYAQAGGKYAWTLQIDLGNIINKIKKTNIFFSPTGYSTNFQIFYSLDKVKWILINQTDNNRNSNHTFNFNSISARYFRIRSLKPDAPKQEGGQMCVTEFQLYN